MICPYCAHPLSRVTNKRGSPEGVRRRRECLKCKKRYTTYERVCRENLYVLKKDGSREPFERSKLERGIKKAFEKRPISEEMIDKMINEIEEQIRKKGKKEVSSALIGEIVMKKIKKLDNVAYIRFASVYRNFQNTTDFEKELEAL